MQYILTEEEYKDLLSKKKHEISLSKKKLQTLCSHVADHMPVQEGWYKGKPWGCILIIKNRYEWYCDDCPVKDICPSDVKRWSQ